MTDHIGDANKKVTAVEWLFLQLYERFEMKGDGLEMDKVLEQAKAMEKSAIEKAVTFGNRQDCYDATETLGERYYIDTFKNK
jgi:hypothetical protein